MNRIQRALFSLVRSGLWARTDEDMSSVFPLSVQEWDEVMQLAQQQTVLGIAFCGMTMLPEDKEAPVAVMAKWMAYADRIEENNRRMNRTVNRLFKSLEEHGVEAVLQKGQGVAAMYPEPLLRECGDIDLYFPEFDGKFNPIAWISDGEGHKSPDGSWLCSVDGITVECHRNLIDIARPSGRRFVEEYIAEKGYEKIVVGAGEKVEVLVPSPELNLLLLSTHILKHAMGVGIGLRQLCDMAMATVSYADRIDEETMQNVYKRTGFFRWTKLLDDFLEMYIKNAPSDFKKSHIILDIILKGGNFGHFAEERKNASKSKWRRKLHTLGSFVKNMRFAITYAHGEWLFTIAQLMRGQIR